MRKYILMASISQVFIILHAQPAIKPLPGITQEQTLALYEKLLCHEDFKLIQEALKPVNPLEVLAFSKVGDTIKPGVNPQEIMSQP
ncbi:MAG: hypothetical protein K2X90_00805 [Candidatus Babeliaceae bacterium]|nr:hypothetical protein [Candidatus Babeliaceae bacterium]